MMTEQLRALEAAGLPAEELQGWTAARIEFPSSEAARRDGLARDAQAATRFYERGAALLGRLAPKPRRGEVEGLAAETLKSALRDARVRFLRAYGALVYADLTEDYGAFVRAEELVYLAAERYPGLTPSRRDVAEERDLPLKDKDGAEIDQGIFLSQILSLPRAGAHLVHAMLRPKPDSLERLAAFQRAGALDLGTAYVQRKGKAGYVYLRNPQYLNAEDDSTADALETAADLVILDPRIEVGVLRGAPVDHPRYRGRRVFSSGINLTRLYQGKIPFLFYITRDMAFVNKLYRGLTGPKFLLHEPESTQEKPWIAGVDAFAIGGGCQLLLVMDYVVAEAGSFFNLPARKEGIVPGVANLRLPRYVGERPARQGILFDRQFPADTPEGRMLCDAVVPADEMDAALSRAIETLTGSGVVSAAGNRKALRVGQEPLDTYRAYMATYAREQAYCHFSPALVRNLEEHWNARQRSDST